jgi:hypothetical protein
MLGTTGYAMAQQRPDPSGRGQFVKIPRRGHAAVAQSSQPALPAVGVLAVRIIGVRKAACGQ